MAGDGMRQKTAGDGEAETKVLTPEKEVSTTPGGCLEIIRTNNDSTLRRHAAVHLLGLIDRGTALDEPEIRKLRRKEKDPAVHNALSRVIHKLGFRRLLDEDPAAPYDKKLLPREEAALYEEIARLKGLYDKAKKQPGAFDEKYMVSDREIGKGGMGRILKGTRRSDGMEVAFKYLMLDRLSRYAARQTLTALFLNEGRLLSERLSHPHVIRAFDYGEADGEYFIVMEYVESTPLIEWAGIAVSDSGWFEDTGLKILGALEYVHEEGVIHRDINPKNIIMGKGTVPAVKLIDFGLALDRRGGFVAPPGFRGYNGAYSSPQQKADFNDVDERDDIYSIGVVFSEILGGRTSGNGIDDGALARLTERVRGVLARCMEKEREKRWKNVGEVRQALFR
ncbi:MAG TPA: serine/threonine-protein kinase [Syntrophorhabdaceae bacterium]|jgi:hypothetical protein